MESCYHIQIGAFLILEFGILVYSVAIGLNLVLNYSALKSSRVTKRRFVEAVRRMAKNHYFVITSGGTGLTHDDVTHSSR
ncbi:uncharacterized protein V1518DRAFT_428009 [Limtongia smithiae]|uniref:uncharacterized protein n=1 Tax=Limtongia smithiae TaxID=1125753 RepID=UPI0034CF95B7